MRSRGRAGGILAGAALLCLLVVPQTGAADYIGGGQSSAVNSLLNPEVLVVRNGFIGGGGEGQELIRVPIVSAVTLIPSDPSGQFAELQFAFGPTADPSTFEARIGKQILATEPLPGGGVRVLPYAAGDGRTTVVSSVSGTKPSGASAGDTDRVTVKCCVGPNEQPPVADAGPDQTVSANTLVSLNGSGSGDPNGDSLTFSWEQVGGIPVTLSDDGAEQPTFMAPPVPEGQVAMLEFALSVNDGIWTSFPDVVVVVVVGTPDPPVCEDVQDQIVLQGDTVVLDGSLSSDPNGLSITCDWAQIAPPDPTMTLVPIGPCSVEFVATDVGTFTFRLTVTNELGLSCQDDATVLVNAPNQPPVAVAGDPQTVLEGDMVMLDGSASFDPDFDPLSFLWEPVFDVMAGCSLTPVVLSGADTDTASFVAPDVSVEELLCFMLTVSDGEFSDTAETTVTVQPITGTVAETGVAVVPVSMHGGRPVR